jgi:hypothetical protein
MSDPSHYRFTIRIHSHCSPLGAIRAPRNVSSRTYSMPARYCLCTVLHRRCGIFTSLTPVHYPCISAHITVLTVSHVSFNANPDHFVELTATATKHPRYSPNDSFISRVPSLRTQWISTPFLQALFAYESSVSSLACSRVIHGIIISSV